MRICVFAWHKAHQFLAGYYVFLGWYHLSQNRSDTMVLARAALERYERDHQSYPTTARFFCELGAQMCQLGSLKETAVASVRVP